MYSEYNYVSFVLNLFWRHRNIETVERKHKYRSFHDNLWSFKDVNGKMKIISMDVTEN